MKRKLLVILLALCAVSALAFGLSACGEHAHTYGDWVTVTEPTCTVDGLKERYCKDGDGVEREAIPATGHTEVKDEAVAPTCTETGLTEGKHCSVCEAILAEQEVIPAHGHDFEEEWVWDGNTSATATLICKRDSAHAYNLEATITYEVITEATYEIVGEEKYTATVVFEDTEYTDTKTETIPILSHTYELKYTLNSDKQSYSVSLGNATDTDIVIPSTYFGLPVTKIDSYAFINALMTSIRIPASVTYIGGRAFEGCASLTSIEVDEKNEYYKSIDGNLYSKDGTTLVQYAIGKTDTSFTIPENVTTISYSAFRSCASLKSVTIPENVTSIDTYAFYNCTALIEINYNATECADLSYNSRVFEQAGESGDGITLNIGANVKKIPAYLFYPIASGVTYLSKIVRVVFAENSQCTSIGDYAFYNCALLESITIPDSLTSIGYYAFDECTCLTAVYITDIAAWCGISFGYKANPLIYAHNLYLNGELVTELIIPDSVTSIGDATFCGCTSLTTVTIPENVTSIGVWAFLDCTSLTRVKFKKTSGWWYSSSGTATSGTEISSTSLANSATAATCLTSTYYKYYWKRT